MTFKEGDKVICVKSVRDSDTVMNKIGIVDVIHNTSDDPLLYVKFDMENGYGFTFGWNIKTSALKLYKPDPLLQSMLEVIRHD